MERPVLPATKESFFYREAPSLPDCSDGSSAYASTLEGARASDELLTRAQRPSGQHLLSKDGKKLVRADLARARRFHLPRTEPAGS